MDIEDSLEVEDARDIPGKKSQGRGRAQISINASSQYHNPQRRSSTFKRQAPKPQKAVQDTSEVEEEEVPREEIQTESVAPEEEMNEEIAEQQAESEHPQSQHSG